MQDHRQYQQQAHIDLRHAFVRGKRSPLFVGPTGCGKTVIAKDLISSAVAKGSAVLFLAPRRTLIHQTSAKLARHQIAHGVIMAGEEGSAMAGVQVASIPTLYHRAIKRQAMPMPNAKVVLIDEAHLARGGMTMQVLAAYPNAVKIGLTATPCRTDGRGLGEVFDELVLGPSVQELIDDGYLVKPIYFVPSRPDLSKVKVDSKTKDYLQTDLAKAMDNTVLVGDVLTNWLRLGRGRRTVIFTVNVAHSLHVESVFRQAGVKIAHIDANTPDSDRATIMRDLREGRLECVTNCDVLTLGWDEPSVSCCVLARPTKSLARYMQAVGRVLRPSPDTGKKDCLILDHGNCVEEHGLVEDPHDWALSADKTVKERDEQRKKEKREPKNLTCGACTTVFRSLPSCPLCGWAVPHGQQMVHTVEDDLAELRDKKRLKREWTGAQKDAFLGELKYIALQKSYKSGWAAWKYKERLGTFPRNMGDTSPRRPTPETMAWLKHMQIKNAKRREKERVQQSAQQKAVANVG